MNWLLLASAFLARRWAQAVSVVVAGALGIAMMQMVLIAERELPKAASQAFGGVDLVVGPSGSALDLVLCCVLHVSDPRGLIPMDAAIRALASPLVRNRAPIALGDNLNGVRIVGTTPEILDVYHAQLATGRMWNGPEQAVLGAQAAHSLKLSIGDGFVGAHGLSEGGEPHDEFPYVVTGILKPTGSALDRLILTSIDTVWDIHRFHDEEEARNNGKPSPPKILPMTTAFVASVKSPVALASLPRQIAADDRLGAASPAFESARLDRAARPVIQGVLGIGVLFALVAAITAAAVLAAAMSGGVRDLALLRVLGAHRWEMAAIAIIQAVILSVLAVVVGEAVVAILSGPVADMLAEHDGLLIVGTPSLREVAAISGGALLTAILAAVVPAVRAMRAPVESLLSS